MNGFVHGSVLGHLLIMQSFNNVESVPLPLNIVVHAHVPFWLVEVALCDGRGCSSMTVLMPGRFIHRTEDTHRARETMKAFMLAARNALVL